MARRRRARQDVWSGLLRLAVRCPVASVPAVAWLLARGRWSGTPWAAHAAGLAALGVCLGGWWLRRRMTRVSRRPVPQQHRPASLLSGATDVYRLYDARGALLYVGITRRGRFPQRMREHSSKWWWPQVAPHRATVQTFATRRGAETAERLAIASEHPAHNVAGSGRQRAYPAA